MLYEVITDRRSKAQGGGNCPDHAFADADEGQQQEDGAGKKNDPECRLPVITSYSIHYTKLYEKRFAERLVDALEEVGVPRCPGNTMASNPKWRHSLSEWKDLLEQWIAVPKGEHT